MRTKFFVLLLQRAPLRRIVKRVVPSPIRLRLLRLVSPLEKLKLADPMTMDEHLLGMIITHRGHRLDKATKGESDADCAQYKSQLEAALETCRVKKRAGDHISWAERVLTRYQRWEKEKKRILEPVTTNRIGQTDDIYGVIRGRRSIRYFQDGEIEKEKIERILEAGGWAPCSGNRQAWHFVVQKVGKVAGDVKSKTDSENHKSPHGAIVLYVAMDERLYPWKYAAAMDAAAAIQNMLLMAHQLGIGACWYYGAERLNQAKLRARLGLPNYCYIYSTVQLGYPAEEPEAPGRKPLSETATFIGFNGKE